MNKTKIDWCDSTWNPVTGCLRGCEYCYARRIVKRFSNNSKEMISAAKYCGIGRNGVYEINEPWSYTGKAEHYPFGFEPTFHKYRLNDYRDKQGRNIFVCSMADLFGKWVPDEWIEEVFKACEKAPQHNYIFLTKNSKRYLDLDIYGKLPKEDNFWYGQSVTKIGDKYTDFNYAGYNWFLSLEPLLAPLTITDMPDWVIVGAETGRRKGKVIPKREWIKDIVNQCKERQIPVFMKSSLADIWGEPLIQEFPKSLKERR